MAFLKKEEQTKAGYVTEYTAIKLRLYPTPEQAEIIEQTFHCCRYLWNQMLSDEREFYAATDLHYIPAPARYKKTAPFLKEADSQALVAVHQNIQRAFRDFFRDPQHYRYPTFKRRKEQKNSYRTYCHYSKTGGPPSVRLEREGVVLPKLKLVRAAVHRRPLHWWHLQYATVSKTRSGAYYCALLYQYPRRACAPIHPAPERTLGLKDSLKHFYVDSEGRAADPAFLAGEEAGEIARLQRRLSRMVPGSKNYEEQLLKLRRCHERLANRRRDYIHKQSTRIANEYDAVCVRAANLQQTARALHCAEIARSGFGRFRDCLAYKLARRGKPCLAVDGCAPTSRTCSRCGAVCPALPPGRVTWQCPVCRARLNREENAAVNLKTVGLSMLSQDSAGRA